MVPRGARVYGETCGWTLARAHARSGDRIAIGSYLGAKDVFDQAIADFAAAYADQNETDYRALVAARERGRIIAETNV
jgi:sugar/nucleoside kinase (ribokinase family)